MLTLQAIAELLEEEDVQIPSWICYSSVDGVNAPSGESFADCLQVVNTSDRIAAVGINCAPPQFVHSLVQKFNEVNHDRLFAFDSFFCSGFVKVWFVLCS